MNIERDTIAVNLMRLTKLTKHEARALADQAIAIAHQSLKIPIEWSSFNQKNEHEIELLRKSLVCFESEDMTSFSAEMECAVISCIKAAIRNGDLSQ